MKNSLCVLVMAVAVLGLPSAARGNLILNGSFENNTAGGTVTNMSNATFNVTVANATAFGAAQEIDLIQGQGPFGGSPPQDGNWKLAIHSQVGGNVDAFSFDLASPVVAGSTYILEFSAENVTTFDPNNAPIEIGLSSSPSAFGTLVYAGLPGQMGWTQFTHTFVAPVGASYLTVRNDPTVGAVWQHIDSFSLDIPEPASLSLLGLGLLALRQAQGRRSRRRRKR